jgi:hypothetical protein
MLVKLKQSTPVETASQLPHSFLAPPLVLRKGQDAHESLLSRHELKPLQPLGDPFSPQVPASDRVVLPVQIVEGPLLLHNSSNFLLQLLNCVLKFVPFRLHLRKQSFFFE